MNLITITGRLIQGNQATGNITLEVNPEQVVAALKFTTAVLIGTAVQFSNGLSIVLDKENLAKLKGETIIETSH